MVRQGRLLTLEAEAELPRCPSAPPSPPPKGRVSNALSVRTHGQAETKVVIEATLMVKESELWSCS